MRPYHPDIVNSITEEQWQVTVTGLATMLGWDFHHEGNSRYSKAGMPDLQLWYPGQYLQVELKKELGIVTPAQQEKLASLERAGIEVHVWRPSMVVDVERRLRTR